MSAIIRNLVTLGLIASITLLGTPSMADSVNTPGSQDIVITKSSVATTPIAFADFNYTGVQVSVPRIEQIIGQDLQHSGVFAPLYNNALPQNIATTPINPQLWVNKDIPYLVVGDVKGTATGLQLEYFLYDMSGGLCKVGTPCIHETVTSIGNQGRTLAHKAANSIFQHLQDAPGDFTTHLAYVSQPVVGVPDYKLIVSDYDGYNPRIVYSSTTPIQSPTWSTDGRYLAFSSYTTFSTVIKQLDMQTGKLVTLVNTLGNNGAPAYSLDGSMLAYSHSNNGVADIYVKNLNTGKTYNLTHGKGRNTEPTWFGNNIIFTSDRNGVAAIYQMELDGSNVKRISRTSGQTTDADVNIPTRNMYMISNDRITVQHLTSGEFNYLATTFLDESLAVSPNGMMLVYSSSNGSKKVLNLISANGIYRSELPIKAGAVTSPAWSAH